MKIPKTSMPVGVTWGREMGSRGKSSIIAMPITPWIIGIRPDFFLSAIFVSAI